MLLPCCYNFHKNFSSDFLGTVFRTTSKCSQGFTALDWVFLSLSSISNLADFRLERFPFMLPGRGLMFLGVGTAMPTLASLIYQPPKEGEKVGEKWGGAK